MNRKMTGFVFAGMVSALMLTVSVHGQVPNGSENLQQLVQRISAARGQNMQAIKAFTWNQRTEVRKDGEITSTRLELVRYDARGQLQRTVLSETKPKEKKRIAGRIQAKKMAEAQAWGESVKALLMRYSLADPESLAGFLGKAAYGLNQSADISELNARNVIQQGDRMAVQVNKESHQILGAEVFTSFEMDPVYLQMTHDVLPEGPSYVRQMTLTAESKGLQLLVENFNYNRD